MKKKMIAHCGVECTKCLAFIATKENDDELRKKQAEKWSRQLNQIIPSESINCDGCLSGGRHVSYCSMCKIKECCVKKKIQNCAFCDNYICEALENAFECTCEVFEICINNIPEAKNNLDEIRKSLSASIF
jgi:hypothetical protein